MVPKKIEVKRTKAVGEHHDLAEWAAEYIIERGGKRLMDQLKDENKEVNIYSTKSFTEDQRFLFNEKVTPESSDFINAI